MNRHLALLLLLAAGPAASLPEVGRLFLTPAQRLAIERQRQPPAPAAPRYIDEVRGPCSRTVWLDGQPRHTITCPAGGPCARRLRP